MDLKDLGFVHFDISPRPSWPWSQISQSERDCVHLAAVRREEGGDEGGATSVL